MKGHNKNLWLRKLMVGGHDVASIFQYPISFKLSEIKIIILNIANKALTIFLTSNIVSHMQK